ncbi:tetratricopeptide repeat protein [Paracoccus sp. (in: a-proteobacteria)]|uniref:tetratricopeptide repeat protein n=1 Tax=Paracoccus sp. TaxID=267 RepID=UPI00272B866E|nr:tetratricopeptide repeat protein [Paracoccus sp. (in: a-proteobacteria)]
MTQRPARRPWIVAALLALLAAPALADDAPAPDAAPIMRGLAGPYLAARMATVENDFLAAARYYARALAQDPSDPYLQDSALVALASAGQVDRAVAYAETMLTENGGGTEFATLMRRSQLIREGDWDALLAYLDERHGTDMPISEDLMDGTIRAWALLGAGRASDSLEAFRQMAAEESIAPVVNYHLALALALVGDYEGADALLAEAEASGHLLGLTARAQILAQLDRRDEAVAMLDSLPGLEAEPQLMALRAALVADEPVAFDVVAGPADGIAQLFLAFASALSGGPDPEPLSLIHARLAVWLQPENTEARLLVAQLLQERQQFDLAEDEYEAVRARGQIRPVAELSRIDALSRGGRRPDAEKAALALTAAYPDLAQAWVALGDVLRMQEKHDMAVPAYDKALSLLADAPPQARWFPLYARGIALERSGRFERAEADLLAAIEIRDDNASLLNYLGYSWIDRNIELERGLDLIKRAVELSPDDGYILDSLAWAYFRLGRYEDAVAPMERAIATMASDPLVNDHLGDIYWMVGREREAQIQWKRALSLEPTESGEVDPARIRDKLERGLDAVMADEAALAGGRTPPDPQSVADTSEAAAEAAE